MKMPSNQMKGVTRYNIEYPRKTKRIEELPRINQSIYNEPKFKHFLKDNFKTIH